MNTKKEEQNMKTKIYAIFITNESKWYVRLWRIIIFPISYVIKGKGGL